MCLRVIILTTARYKSFFTLEFIEVWQIEPTFNDKYH